MGISEESNGLTLIEISEPSTPGGVPNATQTQLGPYLTPAKIISTYDDSEWEEFTDEWVSVLPGYVRVRRVGGAGDRGNDVVAFCSEAGFRGVWDSYQCKHYANPLTPIQGFKEIFKILRGVLEDWWIAPRSYSFIAPRECGPKLTQLLDGAGDLRVSFIAWLEKVTDPEAELKASQTTVHNVLKLAQRFDFGIFDAKPLKEVLTIHQGTKWHIPRFGGGIPPLPETPAVPISPDVEELPYLRALLHIYVERYGEAFDVFSTCVVDKTVGRHLLRQREAFFSAQTLERHVRDLVAPGTYDFLKRDLLDGVIETAEAIHPSGWVRLEAVLSQAVGLDISANALVQACRPVARKGICHQLAGDGDISWIQTQP